VVSHVSHYSSRSYILYRLISRISNHVPVSMRTLLNGRRQKLSQVTRCLSCIAMSLMYANVAVKCFTDRVGVVVLWPHTPCVQFPVSAHQIVSSCRLLHPLIYLGGGIHSAWWPLLIAIALGVRIHLMYSKPKEQVKRLVVNLISRLG
jgi:hypothetical protein